MINIMYLVLMALLALNVSAEVMNAFTTLDKGNLASINTVDEQLDDTVEGLDKLLDDDSKKEFRVIQPAIASIRSEVSDFNDYIEKVRNTLIDMAGNQSGDVDDGDYIEKKGKKVLVGLKNKDVTTRYLVLGEDGEGGEPGEGEEIARRVKDVRQKLIDTYTQLLTTYGEKPFGLKEEEIQSRIQSVAQNMPFDIDEDIYEGTDKTSWSDFRFGHMPLAAVMPLLSQLQSDLKSSEANLVNDMVGLAGGRTIDVDQFFPVFSADKSYVISGEQINAKVSVGSYSSNLDPSNVDLRVGGQRLRIKDDGTADFTITGRGSGPQTINTSVAVTNPLTGEVTRGEGKFTYEVGQRSVAVSADKMNVFYIGVDNPVTVSAAGVASNDVRVRLNGPATISGSGSKYTVRGNDRGEAEIIVTAEGQNLGTFPFRVERIPNPIPMVGNSRGGKVPSSQFKAQTGMRAVLEDFAFDARCAISGFELVYVPKREDAVPSTNAGGSFNTKSKNMVRMASPGDKYYANNIRAKCPGDKVTREIGTMVFDIQ